MNKPCYCRTSNLECVFPRLYAAFVKDVNLQEFDAILVKFRYFDRKGTRFYRKVYMRVD